MDGRTRGPRENVKRIAIDMGCNTMHGDPRNRCDSAEG